MSDRVALILGSSGNIGKGVARNFLEQDYTVVITCRFRRKISDLIQSIGGRHAGGKKLFVLHADVSDPKDAKTVVEQIKAKYRRLDAVVSAMGPWLEAKPMHEMTHDFWRNSSLAMFESHFTAYNAIVPFMISDENECKVNKSYTIVTAAVAEEITHFTSFWAANLRNLSVLARRETAELESFRVQELCLGIRVEDESLYMEDGNMEQCMPSTEFGRIFPALASDSASELKGQVISVTSKTVWQELVNQY